jgi:hypothetical protein
MADAFEFPPIARVSLAGGHMQQFVDMCDEISATLGRLSDSELVAELAVVAGDVGDQPGNVAAQLLLRLYEFERDRRGLSEPG